MVLLHLSRSITEQVGRCVATLAAGSPDGHNVLYATDNQVVVADTQGATQTTLSRADASWSTQDAILLGSDTNLFQVRPDGSNQTRLGNGTYHSPLWAPNAPTFAFVT